MIKTDVCIIGAGPSGAATSLMLSNLKISHYIIVTCKLKATHSQNNK